MKKLLLILFTSLLCSEQLDIQYIGNASFVLSDGKKNVFIDFPYEVGAYGFAMDYSLDSIITGDNNISIITHHHGDHWWRKGFMDSNNKLFAPYFVRLFVPKSRKILFKEHTVIDDLIINPIKTPHGFTIAPFGFNINLKCISHYSYILFWHNKKIFISGDANSEYELLQRENNIDIAIITYWNGEYAFMNNKNIDANNIILCHFFNLEQIPQYRESIDKEKLKINALFGENTNIHVLDQYEHLYINIDE